jgi:glycosyltransferase involved in cell wall biosynthesis
MNEMAKRKRKILLISALDIWSLGGKAGAQSLWKTLDGYQDYGWEVIFLTSNKDRGRDKKLVDKKIKIIRFDFQILKKLFRIKIIEFLARNLWWVYFQTAAFLLGFKVARKERVEVFYGYEVYGAMTAKILSWIFKKPVVSRFQGTLLSKYLDGGWRWRLRYWWHILALKTKVDLLIMTNDGTRGDLVLRNLSADMSKVKFWVNGVDKSIFNQKNDGMGLREDLNIPHNCRILLSVSRLEKWKRVDRIIKALPLVLNKMPDVKLLIVGEGNDKKFLEGLVRKLGVGKSVLFLGTVPHDFLGKYYDIADIFVSMYDISNVGNPLLEAMSCGKCVVSLDVGDTNKFVMDGRTGVLIKIPSEKEISEVILKLLNDKDKMNYLGKGAKNFADKNIWTWEKRIDSELKEVRKLLN